MELHTTDVSAQELPRLRGDRIAAIPGPRASAIEGWDPQGLPAEDQRVIRQELALVRRDTDTLPHVVRGRGLTALAREHDLVVIEDCSHAHGAEPT